MERPGWHSSSIPGGAVQRQRPLGADSRRRGSDRPARGAVDLLPGGWRDQEDDHYPEDPVPARGASLTRAGPGAPSEKACVARTPVPAVRRGAEDRPDVPHGAQCRDGTRKINSRPVPTGGAAVVEARLRTVGPTGQGLPRRLAGGSAWSRGASSPAQIRRCVHGAGAAVQNGSSAGRPRWTRPVRQT